MRWISPLIGIGMAALLIWQASEIGWDTIARVWPSSPAFYLLFATGYLAPVLSELFIYRRLWHGVGLADLPMFLTKRVMNDALVSYSGEAYAVVWARRRNTRGVPPLAAVKDVNIMSAVVGILSTFLLIAATFLVADGARIASVAVDKTGEALAISAAIMLVALAVILLKPRLLTLPRRELGLILGIHTLRVATGIATTILMWAVALPGIATGLWFTLAAWRAAAQRLPFVSNKELLFVNLAILALGDGGREVAALLAVSTALTAVAHLAVALLALAPARTTAVRTA